MEFLLKLGRVLEKSWNFEIGAKSLGKVMEFGKQNFMNWRCYAVGYKNTTNVYDVNYEVMKFCHKVMENHWKVMEFGCEAFVATLKTDRREMRFKVFYMSAQIIQTLEDHLKRVMKITSKCLCFTRFIVGTIHWVCRNWQWHSVEGSMCWNNGSYGLIF